MSAVAAATDASAITRELRAVLLALGDALASHDLDAILAAEPRLASVVAAVDRITHHGPLPSAVADDLAAARVALARCRRLGNGFEAFVAAMHAAHGSIPDYTRPPTGGGSARPVLTARA